MKIFRAPLLILAVVFHFASTAQAGSLTHTIVAVTADSITIGKNRREKLIITPASVIFVRGEKSTVGAVMVGMRASYAATEGKLVRLDVYPPPAAAK